MPPNNDRIADAFEELADLLQIAGSDRFRILAYRRVAEEVRALAKDAGSLSDAELAGLRGVGKATAAKIREFLATGTMAKLEQARSEVPAGIRQLTALQGVGPRTAMRLHEELGVGSVKDLEKAVEQGRVRTVRGMGPKTEQNVARALKAFAGGESRVLLDVATSIADAILAALRELPEVERAERCGSLRRMKETIGDIDLLATGGDPQAIMDLFVKLPQVQEVAAKGTTKSTVLTARGVRVDLRAVAADEFGAALQYFTGSQEHNVRVREIAVKQGYKLSEYGLFTVEGNRKVAGADEQEIYRLLGMQMPPPPMRENRGEIEAAQQGRLQALVQEGDLLGDLHSHTIYSDGSATVREVALEALRLGRRYLAITDHLDAWVKSHTIDSIRRQAEEIAQVNDELDGRLTVLQGVEVDIRRDGTLALTDEMVDAVDLVIVSIHQQHGLGPEAMTKRVVRALERPGVNIFGHPTGRRIGGRPAAEFDLETVFGVAEQNNVILEVNSSASRLDLKDDHLRLARRMGCRFSIATDSHHPRHLARIGLGVGMAQRGWLTPDEVVNTRELDDLKNLLAE
ncbi:MAG: DNA polymerase/3'-5' exonuclease PolX [Actinomycetota bacterium]